jgi:hypothetical protein
MKMEKFLELKVFMIKIRIFGFQIIKSYLLKTPKIILKLLKIKKVLISGN